jgi:hypothetical protein
MPTIRVSPLPDVATFAASVGRPYSTPLDFGGDNRIIGGAPAHGERVERGGFLKNLGGEFSNFGGIPPEVPRINTECGQGWIMDSSLQL